MYSVQMISTTHWSLKAVYLETAPTVGTVHRMHISGTAAAEDRLHPTLGSTASHGLLIISLNQFCGEHWSTGICLSPCFKFFAVYAWKVVLLGHMVIQLNGHEFEQTPGNSEGQGSLACCSPWGLEESDMT